MKNFKNLFTLLLPPVFLICQSAMPASNTVAPALSYSGPQNYYVGKTITPLGPSGGGTLQFGYGASATAIGSGFLLPSGVATDAAGNIYVADESYASIVEIPAAGGPNVYIGSGFWQPVAVAVDAAGN